MDALLEELVRKRKRNRRVLMAALIILGGAIVSAFVFLQVFRLTEPVFLPNFCEYEWNQNEEGRRIEFPIRYVQDVSDSRRLTGIEFDTDVPINSYVGDNSIGDVWSFINSDGRGVIDQGEVVGRYRIQTVYCSIVPNWPEGQAPEEIVLKHATIELDGKQEQSIDADLGTIILRPERFDYRENGIFVNAGAGASSDGTSFDEYHLRKGVTFSGIDSNFAEETKGLFRLKINGTLFGPAEEYYVSSTERLRIDMEFPMPDDPTAKLTRFLFDLNLNYSCVDGTQGNLPVWISYEYSLDADFGDLWRYIKESGVK